MHLFSKYFFLTYTVFFIFTSCSNEIKRVAVDEVPIDKLIRKNEQNLHLDLIPPELYTLSDDLLLILPYRSSTKIRIYKTDSQIMRNGTIDKYEDQIPLNTDKDVYATTTFLNKSTNAYVEYELKNGNLTLKRNTSMGDLNPDDVIRIGSDIYINLGDYKEGIFKVLNNKKKKIKSFGKIPFQPNRFHHQLNSSKGHMSMQENDLYFVSQYFGYLACYQYKRGKLSLKWEKQITDFNYEERAKEINPEDDNPVGFDGIIAKRKYIYTLYNRNFLSDPQTATQSLLIFDRKGNPAARCELPFKVKSFAIDHQEKYMYVVQENARTNLLIQYQLPPINSGKFNGVSKKLRTFVEKEINEYLNTGE
ncbi:MAG: BF3164 family lipoprotein [Tannerellaceae bacterium]|nr:BF3164 family lipoprotein [Tannerellaceae bacterium]